MQKPSNYNYMDNLLRHVGKDYQFFGEEFVYPRQLEIHLPGNGKIHCNLDCKWCQGRYFKRDLGNWELEGLALLNNLKGSIPYHIYGGAYTEPLLNLHLLTYLETTKKYGNSFGIHTNGTLLLQLEQDYKFLTRLNEITTTSEDYLSISLDGGQADSWCKVKNSNSHLYFYMILSAIKLIAKLDRKFTFRLCYLISEETGTKRNLDAVVKLAQEAKVDSLRFSIPYQKYNLDFKVLKKYRDKVEVPQHEKYIKILEPYLSKTLDEKPYIFYVNPATTSVCQYNFSKCIYSYYQMTIGADGYLYKCSSVAAPTAKLHRIDKLNSDLEYFKDNLIKSYDENWDSNEMCFKNRLRCNRMAIECNQEYNKSLIKGTRV